MKQGFVKKSTALLVVLLIFVLISRIILTVFNLHNPSVHIQQDNYATYANALKSGNLSSPGFPDFERRLFPGYPILIYIVSFITQDTITAGLIISILASVLVTFLLWILIDSPVPALLSTLFPPIWIKQGAKVATEPIFAATAIMGWLLYTKKHYFLAGLLTGITCVIRPIGIGLIAVYFFLMIQKEKKKFFILFLGFLVPVLLLLLFNFSIFGPHDLLQQFTHTNRYGGLRFGFMQIIQDFYRTIAWKQYRIFASGLFYVVINVTAMGMLFRKRKQSSLVQFMLLWIVFSLLFILSPSPFTLLDDFGRYTLASMPALVTGLSLFIDRKAGEYVKLPNKKIPQ